MRTVVDVLRDNAVLEDRAHTFVRMDGSEVVVSFPDLWRTACQRARRLGELGLDKGDRVAIILPEADTFVLGFLGCLTAGVVPVPMYPPLTLAKMDAYGDTVRHILAASGAKALITMPGLEGLLGEHLKGAGADGDDVLVILDTALEGELEDDPEPPCAVTPEDLAFLQFTSGSTRKPKGVMVSHENLSVNAEAIMFDGLRSTPRDRGVTWLPLFHDMGLIGFVISPLYAKVPVMFLPTMSFIRRPHIWLDAIHRFRGTITFAPNFAYALAARGVKDEQMEGWDLSCLKVLGCGAEPIQPDVLQRFVDRFAPRGLQAKSLLPCYGLAEATLAVTFVGLEEEMKVDRVCAESMKRGEAKAPNGRGALELVSCGRPFPDHELRIVGEAGTPVPQRVVGQILLRGPSVAAGYWGHPEETEAVFRDGWLHTGDLGYLADGELYVCGRAKDLIIVHGKNYYPQDVERVAAEAYGARQDQCVAFSAPSANGSEECVVVCELPKQPTSADEIDRAVRTRVQCELGVPVSRVVLLERNSMPKTSSGKVRRRETRARLQAGSLELSPSQPRRPSSVPVELAASSTDA